MMTLTRNEQIVELLADVVVDKLVQRGIVIASPTIVVSQYDDAGCARLAGELGDVPLNASDTFFEMLEQNGEVNSVELANALGIDRTPTIAFVLTTPIKRIATRLGLPWPFDVGATQDDRTNWIDRDGIAGRMLVAVRAEKQRRGLA